MIFDILRNPRAALKAVAREQRVWAAAGVVGLWALLNLALTAILVFGGNLREQFVGLSPSTVDQILMTLRTLGPVSAFLLPFVWWIGVSTLMLLATRLFGGRTDYRSMLVVVGVACAPWIAGDLIQLPLAALQLGFENEGWIPGILGTLSFVVSVGSLVWHVVLAIWGGAVAARMDYRGAIASCAVTGLGCATAGAVLLISVLTLIFTLSGPVGG